MAMFLDDDGFMTQFVVSKDKTILYGCPPIMAIRSGLMQGYIKSMKESKAPYELAVEEEKVEYKNALLAVWSFINTGSGSFRSLALDEHLSAWKWMNYFCGKMKDVEKLSWMVRIGDRVKEVGKISASQSDTLRRIVNWSLEDVVEAKELSDSVVDIIDMTTLPIVEGKEAIGCDFVTLRVDEKTLIPMKKTTLHDEKLLTQTMGKYGITPFGKEAFDADCNTAWNNWPKCYALDKVRMVLKPINATDIYMCIGKVTEDRRKVYRCIVGAMCIMVGGRMVPYSGDVF